MLNCLWSGLTRKDYCTMYTVCRKDFILQKVLSFQVIYIFFRNTDISTSFCGPFPQGDAKNNYSQTVCVRAFNSYGAFSDLCFATINVYPYGYNLGTGVITLDTFDHKQVDSFMEWLTWVSAFGNIQLSLNLYYYLCLQFYINRVCINY